MSLDISKLTLDVNAITNLQVQIPSPKSPVSPLAAHTVGVNGIQAAVHANSPVASAESPKYELLDAAFSTPPRKQKITQGAGTPCSPELPSPRSPLAPFSSPAQESVAVGSLPANGAPFARSAQLSRNNAHQPLSNMELFGMPRAPRSTPEAGTPVSGAPGASRQGVRRQLDFSTRIDQAFSFSLPGSALGAIQENKSNGADSPVGSDSPDQRVRRSSGSAISRLQLDSPDSSPTSSGSGAFFGEAAPAISPSGSKNSDASSSDSTGS